VRVLGEPVEGLLHDLSLAIESPMLYGWLNEDNGNFVMYQNGKRDGDLDALKPYVRTSFEDLQRAAAGEMRVEVLESKNRR